MEFFGFNFGGESRTIMQDLPRKPSVDWPAQRNAAASAAPCAEPSAKTSGGLRVRIKTGH
jgi:hypothetical protein